MTAKTAPPLSITTPRQRRNSSKTLLPDALSTQKEIWTHSICTPPSGSPLYSVGDLSWDQVIERLHQQEVKRERTSSCASSTTGSHVSASTGSDSDSNLSQCSHSSLRDALENDLQNRWIEELLNDGHKQTQQYHAAPADFNYTQYYSQYSTLYGNHSTEPQYSHIRTPPRSWKCSSGRESPMTYGRSSPSRSHRNKHSPMRRQKKKNILCKFFMQGKCTKGDNCPFAHTTTPEKPKRSQRKKNKRAHIACKFVSNGTVCPYGDNCLFNHNLHEQQSAH